jgi:hypothetical protein
MRSAIFSQATATGIDPRFILATIIQESKGCVRAPAGPGGEVPNPGLMQSYMGTSCEGQNPCPDWAIHKMVQDGTAGTFINGDPNLGLRGRLNQAAAYGGSFATQVYRAARLYNSGPSGGNVFSLEYIQWGTRSYASDIANRLMGWAGDSSPF